MVKVIPFCGRGMARTRWPPDLATPASCTGQADQEGSAGGCHKNLGPAGRSILKTARAASADSEVRPGPRPPAIRPRQARAEEAGPEAPPTSSLPIICGSGAWSSVPALYADLPFMYPFELVPMTCVGRSRVQGRRHQWHVFPCWDPAGWPGLAPWAAGMSGCGGRSYRAGRHAAGPPGPASWGVISRRGSGDEGCAIQAKSSMAWSRGGWAMSVVQRRRRIRTAG